MRPGKAENEPQRRVKKQRRGTKECAKQLNRTEEQRADTEQLNRAKWFGKQGHICIVTFLFFCKELANKGGREVLGRIVVLKVQVGA